MNRSADYQQCSRCILDTNDDPSIVFDAAGVCNYCRYYEAHEGEVVRHGEQGRLELEQLIAQVKESGKGRSYDCIIGLSGGLDSSYLALQAHKLGLRPLAVHFDNGWNSELSVKNIENIVQKLKFPLYTLVVDWEEFRNLQIAFFKASVVDIEMITDHAIIATLYKLALKHNIRYILSGANYVTEAILPNHWTHPKDDHVHIRAIQKRFVGKSLNTYPLLTSKIRFRAALKNIRTIPLLNYLPYNKETAQQTLQQELEWRNYGGKHYESVFTRFYQGYVLPRKFKIDKRKAHLSNLICSGQLTREEALHILAQPAADGEMIRSDYDFVIKKLKMTRDEFETIMNEPSVPHEHYPVEKGMYERMPFLRILRPAWKLFKRIFIKK